MPDKISDYILERYLLRELPRRRMAEMEILLQRDPEMRDRLTQLRRSNAEILERYPVRAAAAHIRQRLDEQTEQPARARLFPRFLVPAVSLAAVAITLLTIFPPFSNENAIEFTRAKGQATQTGLFLFRKTNSGVEQLSNNALAKPGDLLQIAYLSKQDAFGVIVSLDGRGTVTLHFPAGPQASTRLTMLRKTLLAAAYELDDAPDFERFFLVTSASEIPVKTVLEQAKQLAQDRGLNQKSPLNLPQGLRQISFLVKKGDRHGH
jgi:hypothetical protein